MRQPARILVVDDAPDFRRLLIHHLHGSGMEVSTAENGAVALDAARRVAPDVVVTDVTMPVMDGLALCRRLRAEPSTRRVAVVIMTGDLVKQEAAARAAGCDAVLEKPCSRTLLLATIYQLLDRR
jgi:CheY-like chemotaxis protein